MDREKEKSEIHFSLQKRLLTVSRKTNFKVINQPILRDLNEQNEAIIIETVIGEFLSLSPRVALEIKNRNKKIILLYNY